MVPNKDPLKIYFLIFPAKLRFTKKATLVLKRHCLKKKILKSKLLIGKYCSWKKIRHLLKLITLSLPAFLITFSNTEIVQADEL